MVRGTKKGLKEYRQARLLRAAFLAGAITDALAVIPMLSPPVAGLLWGFKEFSGDYHFAMGYGASLMTGWTALLLWAYRRPVERGFVAVLTIVVIAGLVVTEVITVSCGYIEIKRMIGTWLMQGLLLTLFAGAYYYQALRRRFGA